MCCASHPFLSFNFIFFFNKHFLSIRFAFHFFSFVQHITNTLDKVCLPWTDFRLGEHFSELKGENYYLIHLKKIVIKKKLGAGRGNQCCDIKNMLPARQCERSSLLYCSFILLLSRKYRSVRVSLFLSGVGQGIRSWGCIRIINLACKTALYYCGDQMVVIAMLITSS